MKRASAAAVLLAVILQPVAGWSFDIHRAIDLQAYDRAVGQPGPGPLLAQGPKLTLEELGLGEKQAAADPELQALLDRRAHMLKLHQRWGLATAVPMLAGLLSGNSAKDSSGGRTLHSGLGSAAAAMYLATAYYAVRAPNIPGAGPKKGVTRIHRALAFVHYPAMLLTPIAGFAAKRQAEHGQDAHSLGQQHPTIATTAAVSFLLAMGVMVFNF